MTAFETYESLKQQGDEAFCALDYDLALIYYEKAKDYCLQDLELYDGEMPELYKSIGAVYVEKKQYDLAEKLLHEALSKDPLCWQAVHNLGILQTKYGNMQEAICYFLQAIEINANALPPYMALGDAYKEIHDYKYALSFLKQTIIKNPDNFTVYIALANFYLESKFYDEVLSVLDLSLLEARHEIPYRKEISYILGKACYAVGRFEDSIKAYIIHVNLPGSSIKGYLAFINIYHFLGNYKAVLEVGCQLMLSAPRALNECSLLYLSNALSFFRENVADLDCNLYINCHLHYLEKCQKNPIIYHNLSLLYSIICEFEKAIVYSEKALAVNGKSKGYYYQLAKLRYEMGDFHQALKNFKMVHWKSRTNSNVLQIMADIYRKEGLIEESAQCEYLHSQLPSESYADRFREYTIW